jgi:hypothetical protein
MDCTCNEVRFFLLQSQVDRLERELRVMQAQIGIHLHDFTVAFSSGNAYSFVVAREDIPALTNLVHSANETALLLGFTETVSIEAPPFAATMASDGKDWRGLITYSHWRKPLAFASRTDLNEMRHVIAKETADV